MKALVTGAAGFIGSHIAERLIKDGHKVRTTDDLSAGYIKNIPNKSEFLLSDITHIDVDFVARSLLSDVDVVFHNAASKKNICLNNPVRDLEVNGGGTLKLLMACRKYGVKKFVHASTGSVYGEVHGVTTEETLCNPVSHYGVSKLAGERYVNMFSEWLDTTILRYFHVYGPRQESDPNLGGVVAVFKQQIKEGKPITIHGSGKQVRSFTHVDDVVEANMRAWKRPEAIWEIYNCASGHYTTINELAKKLIKESGKDIEVRYEPELEGDIFNFNIDNSKIKRDLGIKFKTI
jgi:nucleoside-diphosphate-sugar epimerase